VIQFDAGKWEGLDGLGQDVLREMRPRAERLMKTAGTVAEGEVKRTLTGARHGRTYRVSRTGKLHRASAPGEPPAVLTGALRNSVGHTDPEWRGWEVYFQFGPGLGVSAGGEVEGYARRLEYGGADSRGIMIEARPYMEPSVQRLEPQLERLFAGSL